MMIPVAVAAARASEIKFVVEPALGERIRVWARTHLEPDPYGAGLFADEYDTTTLYFDTQDYDAFHRRGSFGRARYRIRRYGSSEAVFVERKLRRGQVLAKRRTQVPLDDLKDLGQAVKSDRWAAKWFERRLIARRLVPVCQVSYHRMARGMMTTQGVARLTLDSSVAARESETVRFSSTHGTQILADNLILELKFRTFMPAVFKGLIEEFRLNPQTASKYRLGIAARSEERRVGKEC